MNYIVRPNDTIYSIANRYNIPVNELINANNLSGNSFLFPGMIIYIPIRPRVRPIPPIYPPRPVPPANFIYIVQRGDTIWSIAREFRVSVETIMFMNGLRFPIVFPKQRLIIPIRAVPL